MTKRKERERKKTKAKERRRSYCRCVYLLLTFLDPTETNQPNNKKALVTVN